MILYDDYNIDDNDIREYFGLEDDEEINDYNYCDYTQYKWEDLIEDLTYCFEHSNYYIAEATRSTHYPEFYKSGSVGYMLLKTLEDISKITQDYNIVEYSPEHHQIEMTTIGHDNNYDIIIRPLNKQGTQYVDRHSEEHLYYDTLEKLFNKYTKRLKEIR